MAALQWPLLPHHLVVLAGSSVSGPHLKCGLRWMAASKQSQNDCHLRGSPAKVGTSSLGRWATNWLITGWPTLDPWLFSSGGVSAVTWWGSGGGGTLSSLTEVLGRVSIVADVGGLATGSGSVSLLVALIRVVTWLCSAARWWITNDIFVTVLSVTLWIQEPWLQVQLCHWDN